MNSTPANNPAAGLLKQALSLVENQVGIPVIVDYEEITRAAIEAYRKEQERKAKNPRILVTQNEAHKLFGYSVIRALVRRGKLQQYKFDLTEEEDLEGNTIRRAKGTVYYRLAAIEKAVEEGNIYKGTRRLER